MSLERPNSGRPDYDAAAHFTQLEPGEPYFLIRGRDALSAPAVRSWAALAHDAFAPMAIVETALQQADAMEAWPTKKLPNAEHLTDAEVLQLTYQLERRAWSAQKDCTDPRIMLAEERAITAALSRLRPILFVLFEGLTASEDGTYFYSPPRDERGALKERSCPIEALRRLATVLRGPEPIDA